jgi:hypothetical protein
VGSPRAACRAGILALLAAPGLVHAATITVDASGNLGVPTLAEGLALAVDGDTVEVESGHYFESISVPSGVTVRSVDQAVVRIVGASWAEPVVTASARVVLDGLHLYGGSPGVQYVWTGVNDGMTIIDSVIEASYSAALHVPPTTDVRSAATFRVRRSEIRHPAGRALDFVFIGGSDGLEHTVVVQGVSIVGAGSDAIAVEVDVNHEVFVDVRQNTLIGAASAALHLLGDWSGAWARVEGNVVQDNGSSWQMTGGVPLVGPALNVLWGNGAAVEFDEALDVVLDPSFYSWSDDGNDRNDSFALSCTSLGRDLLPADPATDDVDGTPGDAGSGGGPWALPRRGSLAEFPLSGGQEWAKSTTIFLPTAVEEKEGELLRLTQQDATACGRADCEDVRLTELCDGDPEEIPRSISLTQSSTFELRFAARTRPSDGEYCVYEMILSNPAAGAPDYCDRILLDDDFNDGNWNLDPGWQASHPGSFDVQSKDGHGNALYGPTVDTGSLATFTTWYTPTQIGGGRGLHTHFSEWCGSDSLYGIGHETDLASPLQGVEGGGLRFTAKGQGTGAYPSLTSASGSVLQDGVFYCDTAWKDWSIDWDPDTLAIAVHRDDVLVAEALDLDDRFVVEGTGVSHINTGYWYDDIQVATFPFTTYADSTDMILSAWPATYRPQDRDGDGLDASVDCEDEDPSAQAYSVDLACDGVDGDCDGLEAAHDVDGDGFESVRCAGGTDCDDSDQAVFPGAEEICDGRDNDCDPSTTPGGGTDTDDDHDSYLGCDGDCDDGDDTIHQGALDACGDGVDSDCQDGYPAAPENEIDGDGDLWLPCSDPQDCNDDDPAIHPVNPEACDGEDTDCDPSTELPGDDIDSDGDGSYACADCDDNDARRAPHYEEQCDHTDGDCDGDRLDGEPDRDGDGVPDCVDFDQTPGLRLNCDVSGGSGAGWLLLCLVPLLLSRRRSAGVVGLLLIAATAQAGPADDAAQKAAQVHSEVCVRGVERDHASAITMHAQVAEALSDVNTAYGSTEQAWLLYWRALLALCLDEGELAGVDLQLFLDAHGDDPVFATLAQDARRRLRRAERSDAKKVKRVFVGGPRRDKQGRPYAPFVLGLGLSGGLLNSTDWVLVGPGIDWIGRLYGPLGLAGQIRADFSTEVTTHAGTSHTEDRDTVLPIFAIGVSLRFPTPITPVVALLFQAAPNLTNDLAGELLAGPRLHVGAEIGLGPRAVVALRPAAEVGVLGPFPHAQGRLDVVFRFGPRPAKLMTPPVTGT